ncbi:hypothetical protein BGZ63DRAFT_363165 [Mariannaea sp. PMI_226]|nr:hypothetical protein BGZ63DRAFT_363165 [Mariannaea sp. PMI_226]
MAARPGEENVATLFGDIHYYYGPPDVKPRHHRFDEGSYVYLFENANERRCRIEVANRPGTDDQDAFEGFLDQTHLRYSYKNTCKVSLTVANNVDQSEWHLPTYDPRNENIYHYKLYSLDIYFWTQQDALKFVNGVRMVIQPSQVEILDEPGPPPQPAPMSSVVQQLEHVAISDPQYGAVNPAPKAPAPASGSPQHGHTATQATFAPMAYNPAAPAAPETVQYREKTPPPDEDPLNPLAVAVAHDYNKQPFTPGMPPPSQFPPGGLTSPGLPAPQFGAPQPGLQRTQTMPTYTNHGNTYGVPFPGPPASQPAPQQSIVQPPGQPTPPGANPGVPPPPPGYSYTPQPAQANNPGVVDYSIHQQVYRPSAAEGGSFDKSNYQPKAEVRGRLEENAGRLERGVTGMLKKFEKKFG